MPQSNSWNLNQSLRFSGGSLYSEYGYTPVYVTDVPVVGVYLYTAGILVALDSR